MGLAVIFGILSKGLWTRAFGDVIALGGRGRLEYRELAGDELRNERLVIEE